MFGPHSLDISPLTAVGFAPFGDVDIDPRWLTYDVFECAVTETRARWFYVTSGYSNPWEHAAQTVEPGQTSGAGVAFILESERQGDWAIVDLQRFLAFELVMARGQFGRGAPFCLNDRIPLGGAMDGMADSTAKNVILTVSEWSDMHLVSGDAMFVRYVGVTDAEGGSLMAQGSPA